MEELTIEISVSNAAFEGNTGEELARILRKLADRYSEGDLDDDFLYDVNGNKTGYASWK